MVKEKYHHGNLRAALIEAGLQVLREAGVDGLSLRECARRVGVTPTAPKNHFGGKQGLLNAVAELGFTQLSAVMKDASSALTDPVDRLPAVMLAYFEFASAEPEWFELMFKSDLRLSGTTELRKAAIGAIEVLDQVLYEFEVHTGGVRSTHGDASLAAWSIVHGLTKILLGRVLPLRYSVRGSDALVKGVISMFCRALSSLPAVQDQDSAHAAGLVINIDNVNIDP